MPTQQTTQETCQGEGILVPLDLQEVHLLGQTWQRDGKICVEVIASTQHVTCPECQHICHKIHDIRSRKKRDLLLGNHHVELIVWKRRFHCESCQKRFTEPDSICGWKRRTTVRLREQLGRQAWSRPVAHVAVSYGVGPRLFSSVWNRSPSQRLKRAEDRWMKRSHCPLLAILGLMHLRCTKDIAMKPFSAI